MAKKGGSVKSKDEIRMEVWASALCAGISRGSEFTVSKGFADDALEAFEKKFKGELGQMSPKGSLLTE